MTSFSQLAFLLSQKIQIIWDKTWSPISKIPAFQNLERGDIVFLSIKMLISSLFLSFGEIFRLDDASLWSSRIEKFDEVCMCSRHFQMLSAVEPRSRCSATASHSQVQIFLYALSDKFRYKFYAKNASAVIWGLYLRYLHWLTTYTTSGTGTETVSSTSMASLETSVTFQDTYQNELRIRWRMMARSNLCVEYPWQHWS